MANKQSQKCETIQIGNTFVFNNHSWEYLFKKLYQCRKCKLVIPAEWQEQLMKTDKNMTFTYED